MTFCLAFARPDLGLVAADTRLTQCWWGVDGQLLATRVLSDDYGKILPVRDGWLVSSLPPEWARRLDPAVSGDADEIAAAVRCLSQEMRRASSNGPAWEAKRLLSCAVWVVSPVGPRIAYRGWSLADGAEYVSGPEGNIGVGMAPGADDAECVELLTECLTDLRGDGRRVPDTLAVVRRVGALFRAVYDRLGPEGPVSDQVEIGLLERDGIDFKHRHLPPARSKEVQDGSDTVLLAELSGRLVG